MNKRIILSCVLVALSIVISVAAHEGATGVVKERMDVMETIQDEMKPLRRMIRGRDDFDENRFLKGVQAVKTVSADIASLFPEGSLDKPSEALPSIWENWDDFSAQASQFHDRILSLEQAVLANNSADINAKFRSAARSCKDCHDDYKADD